MKLPINSSRKTAAGSPSNHLRSQNSSLPKKHQAFIQSSEFYHQLVESLSDCVVFTTDKKGIISSWSKGAKNILGYKKSEVLGKSADIFYTASDRKKKRHEKEMQIAIKRGKAHDEGWHVKKGGAVIWGFDLTFPLYDKQGNVQGFTKIMRELTEHDELHKELQKYRDIFQYTKLGIVIGSADRKSYEWVNPAYAHMHGYTITEMLGTPIIKTFAPGYRKDVPRLLKKANEDGHLEFESYHVRKDGTLFPVNLNITAVKDENGKVLYRVSTVANISKRRRAEEEKQKFVTLIESSNDFIGMSTVKGEWTYINKAGLKMVGLKQKEIDTTRVPDLFPEEERPKIIAARDRLVQNEQLVEEMHFKHFKTGKVFPVSWGGIVLRDTTGQIVGYGTVTRDISKQKQLERQKDDFIGVATHELKTPVTSIKAYAQLLKREFEKVKDTRSADFLGRMDLQLDKLTNLISDLLDVTKIEAGKLQFSQALFDFNRLVHEVVQEMQPTTDKHEIVMKLSEPQKVYGDRDRIGQVIINFLTNAIKYSPAADKIIVRTKLKHDMVVLSVQDFGVGISSADQKKVFQRFYRAEGAELESFPGLGLGLYICADIIKRQGGKIWLKSKKGQGSTFYFSLPISKIKPLK